MAKRSRRDKIRRHLDWSCKILDKYMEHMLKSVAIVADDDPDMSEQLEKLATIALELQKLTREYRLSL